MHSTEISSPQGKNQLSERLPAILRICQLMSSERSLEVLLDLIAREAARLIEADRSSIFLLDPDKTELWSQVALGSDPIRFDARLGIAGAVALTGQTINVEDARQDSRFYPRVDLQTGYRTKSVLAVPLRNFAGDVMGAFQVLNKKDGVFMSDDEELLKALAAQAAIAIETAQLVQELRQQRGRLLVENTQLRRDVQARFASRSILGTSEKIQNIVRLIQQISDTTVNVLIAGESGTGKELVAKAIHYNSPRAGRPLVALNCAALPENLVEAELFGIEKGVATGVDRRIGKFEQANGGTLFLDEIGDLSLAAQAKILRALQEQVVERVGGRRAIPVDVRVVSATHRDLEGEIKKGNFRGDLYYRLKVVHIRTPPLREIRGDIRVLVNHFLSLSAQEMGQEAKELSPGAMNCLMGYSWPGNVRELENEIKRLVATTRRRVIAEEDLSQAIRGWRSGDLSTKLEPTHSFKETIDHAVTQLETRLIREALAACQHNQVKAAKKLGLSRQGLIKKMKRYGIK